MITGTSSKSITRYNAAPIRITLPTARPARPRWRMVCTFGIIALGLWLVGYGLAGLCVLGVLSILSSAIRWYPGTDTTRIYRVGNAVRLYGDAEFNAWCDRKER